MPSESHETNNSRPLIRIEWLNDEHDCDDCGPSYAEGAIIHIEGKNPIEMLPTAFCYDGTSFSEKDVYVRILEELGYRVEDADAA
jgi:hypothetical protein